MQRIAASKILKTVPHNSVVRCWWHTKMETKNPKTGFNNWKPAKMVIKSIPQLDPQRLWPHKPFVLGDRGGGGEPPLLGYQNLKLFTFRFNNHHLSCKNTITKITNQILTNTWLEKWTQGSAPNFLKFAGTYQSTPTPLKLIFPSILHFLSPPGDS